MGKALVYSNALRHLREKVCSSAFRQRIHRLKAELRTSKLARLIVGEWRIAVLKNICQSIIVCLTGLCLLSLFLPEDGFAVSGGEREFKVMTLGFTQEKIEVQWVQDGTYHAKNNLNNASVSEPASWIIEKKTLESADATIDNDGMVAFGDGEGEYTITVTFTERTDCSDTMTLVVGACEEITDSVTFGGFTFSLSVPAEPEIQDNQGYCVYDVTNAGLEFEMPHDTLQIDDQKLENVHLKFKKNPADGAFKDVTFTWTGSKTFKAGLLDAQLSNLSLSIDSGGKLRGSVDLEISLNKDVNVKEVVFLRKGVTGKITLNYINASGWGDVSWNFGGITNLNIELEKDEEVLASATGSLTESGVLEAIMATGGATYNTKGFEVEIPPNSLSIGFRYDITKKKIEITSGSGNLKIKGITGIDGYLDLKLSVSEQGIEAEAGAENAEAFAMEFSDVSLKAAFSAEFDMNMCEGRLSAKHQDFENKFENIEFKVQNGELVTFGLGSVNTRWKNFEVTIAHALYAKNQGLSLDISLIITGMGNMAIENFKISETGKITLEKIEGQIDKSPVNVSLKAAFADSEFDGSFSGKFPGNVAIGGRVVLGVQGGASGFTYVYLKLDAGTNILLGSSGLKIRQISGELGYNFNASAGEGGTGTKQKGTHTIGLGLKLGDVADLMVLGGYVRLILGNASSMELIGDVQVTADTEYFGGRMNLQYEFGKAEVRGALSATLKIPSNGNIILMDNAQINYEVSGGQWAMDGNMSGQFFSNPNIRIQGATDLSAPMGRPAGGMRGGLDGSISASLSNSIIYPDHFNPASCATADDTDNGVGFGFRGDYAVGMEGDVEVQLNRHGVSGSFGVRVNFSGNAKVKWPCLIVCGSNCVDTYSMSAGGTLSASQTGDAIRIKGKLAFSGGGESEETELDITF